MVIFYQIKSASNIKDLSVIIYVNHKWSFTVKRVVKTPEPIGFVPLLVCKNEASLSSLPGVFISPQQSAVPHLSLSL